jgi:hypothetical protein
MNQNFDVNKYYSDQAEGLNENNSEAYYFRGPMYQRGYGLGSYFKKFVTWAIPLLKQHALPVAQSIGKEVVKNVAEVATDALDGKDIKESVKTKIKNSLEKIQKGKGLKRKRKTKQKKSNKQKKYNEFFNNFSKQLSNNSSSSSNKNNYNFDSD